MVSGSLMIRLIDIVLIILLGFLTLSDFSLKTQIKLPNSGEGSDSENQVTLITIKILPDRAFYIKDSESDDLRIVRGAKLLETHLATRQKELESQNRKMMVIVEPHLDTELQLTVDVLDVCELLGIPKSISYPDIISTSP